MYAIFEFYDLNMVKVLENNGGFMKRKQRFNGTIIIGDPCEMVKSEEDWQLSLYGEKMEKIGIKEYITIEFDEDINVVDDSGNILGSFCTDSSLITVMYLDDLLRYNLDFDQHIKYPENWAIIKDFNGEISYKSKNYTVTIYGNGNINFKTIEEE